MIQIYDSKSGKKVPFNPVKEGEISMYVCGPTVYDLPHLGHGRSAVTFDVIRKYFEYKYKGERKVKYVSNYTDIDDKMINRAKDEGISVEDLARKIIPEYEKDYGDLGIAKPTAQPRATEERHIKGMIEIIQKLEKNGYVYVIDGDGVYFDITKYKKYGELSGQNLESLRAGSRVEVKENKRNPYDFVLWKFKKEGEPFWNSPWGDGRPGWHIECSAMSLIHLGEKFDIHGGGLDLKFPHHECEIAQSCGALGDGKFAKYWIHNGFITVNNEKMSKSLGNFFTLRDIFKKYDPLVVRMMFLQTHYRNPIEFSTDLLEQAKAALAKIHDFVRMLEADKKALDGALNTSFDNVTISQFEEKMDDDFDTSGAMSVLFGLMNLVNVKRREGDLEMTDILHTEDFLKKIDEVFGIIYESNEDVLDEKSKELIAAREEARKNKDFKKADEIRDELLSHGIAVEDTARGTIWKRV